MFATLCTFISSFLSPQSAFEQRSMTRYFIQHSSVLVVRMRAHHTPISLGARLSLQSQQLDAADQFYRIAVGLEEEHCLQ